MMKKHYYVEFSLSREVLADNEDEAIELARENILEGNGYYVHDYMNFESAEIIKET